MGNRERTSYGYELMMKEPDAAQDHHGAGRVAYRADPPGGLIRFTG